jgi:predicted lipoprotein with Yx(FWY)xxD motif
MRARTSDARTRSALVLILAAVVGTIGFLIAGSPARSATRTTGTVSLRKTALGSILVNSKGHTLYLFAKDKSGKSSCTSSCATYWPPLLSAAKPTAGTGVKAALLGRTRRSDGTMQVTYNKHPLYTFALDKASGQTKGEGNLAFGAKWYGVSAQGNAVTKAPTSGSTTTMPAGSPTYTNPYPTP